MRGAHQSPNLAHLLQDLLSLSLHGLTPTHLLVYENTSTLDWAALLLCPRMMKSRRPAYVHSAPRSLAPMPQTAHAAQSLKPPPKHQAETRLTFSPPSAPHRVLILLRFCLVATPTPSRHRDTTGRKRRSRISRRVRRLEKTVESLSHGLILALTELNNFRGHSSTKETRSTNDPNTAR